MARHVGDPRIRLEVEDSAGERAQRSGMSVIVGTWRRYSWRGVSRSAKPRCQPSIIASENAHAHAVAQVTHGSARHGSRCATAGPHSTAATPMTIGRDGAPADVGVPPAEDRRRVGEIVDLLRRAVDQRGDDAEVQVRHDESRDVPRRRPAPPRLFRGVRSSQEPADGFQFWPVPPQLRRRADGYCDCVLVLSASASMRMPVAFRGAR